MPGGVVDGPDEKFAKTMRTDPRGIDAAIATKCFQDPVDLGARDGAIFTDA